MGFFIGFYKRFKQIAGVFTAQSAIELVVMQTNLIVIKTVRPEPVERSFLVRNRFTPPAHLRRTIGLLPQQIF